MAKYSISNRHINTSSPIIGILHIPYNIPYTETCREKIQSISQNEISPLTLAMDYTLLDIPHSDFSRPITELEEIYQEKCDKLAKFYLVQVDGLLLPGDRFDVDPSLYGQDKHPETNIYEDPRRSLFIRALIRQSKELFTTPGLGICGSAQQFVVVEGGKLVQHVPDVTNQTINHRQRERAHEVIHSITSSRPPQGSHYYSTIQTPAQRRADPEGKQPLTIGINSIHHQAADIAHLPKSMLLTAIAPDGTVEAMEHKYSPWILVQYHPELLKRMDAKGERTLDNEQYLRNPDGDGKDYDLERRLLPVDEDYYASERLIEDLVDKSIARHQKRSMVTEIDKLYKHSKHSSQTFEPSWVDKVRKENEAFTRMNSPLANKLGSAIIRF